MLISCGHQSLSNYIERKKITAVLTNRRNLGINDICDNDDMDGNRPQVLK